MLERMIEIKKLTEMEKSYIVDALHYSIESFEQEMENPDMEPFRADLQLSIDIRTSLIEKLQP